VNTTVGEVDRFAFKDRRLVSAEIKKSNYQSAGLLNSGYSPRLVTIGVQPILRKGQLDARQSRQT
jgi:hypothetical protein